MTVSVSFTSERHLRSRLYWETLDRDTCRNASTASIGDRVFLDSWRQSMQFVKLLCHSNVRVSTVVLTLWTDVTHFTVKPFFDIRVRTQVYSDKTNWFLTHMAHSWLIIDISEAFFRLELKFIVLHAWNRLEKGTLSVWTRRKVWRQLLFKFFKDVRFGRRGNISRYCRFILFCF